MPPDRPMGCADEAGIPTGMDLIDEYIEHLRQAGATAATIDGRRKILTRLHRDLPHGLDRTCDGELRGWLYRDDWAVNTRATYWIALHGFYGWAANPRDPWLDFDPAAELPPVRTVRGVARPVTDEQLRHILAEAVQPYRLWAVIAAYQGLRCIELAGLDREHITEAVLHVVRGKGGKPRVHDTDLYVWAGVKDLPPGPIARWHGRRATAFEISSNWALYARRHLDMPGVGLHRLRHWLGVTVQRQYRDVRVTQAVLGHAALSSTQVYVDATAEQQREARAMLPRLAG